MLQIAAKENQVASGGDKKSEVTKSVVQISAQPIEPIKTRVEIAKAANVSHDTIAKVKKIETLATPEQKEKLQAGEASINEVFTQIKREEKEAKREEVREVNRALVEETQLPQIAVAGQRFQTLVLDPPWDWGDEGDGDQFGRAPSSTTRRADTTLSRETFRSSAASG
jgi:hypothetical protein